MRIELRHIHKHFGPVHANDDVSLTIEAGTIHGLLGENGAGKSTLVKVLTGYISHDGGDILLDGQPYRVHTPVDGLRAGVGMLHQDPLDFPALTVLENFEAGAGRQWGQGARRELAGLCAQFNFVLDPDETAGNLTVGERQQLELLRMLALGVRCLILDEPTTGISAAQKQQLFAAVRKLADQGKSVVLVSHKLEDVEQICDVATVMRRGKVVGAVPVAAARAGDGRIGQQLVALMFGRELALPTKPQTAREAATLELRGLRLADDRLTLQVGEFTAMRGEVIGLAGLEGSGQQLFLQACAGISHPTHGRVRINGADLTRKPYHAYLEHGVCFVPADRLRDGLVTGLTIQEHVALRDPGARFFLDPAAMQAGAERAIAQFNIRGTPASAVERLSGGNQQRTQLALMPAPLSLLLMEHPTRGLDIESTLWVWQQLIERCAKGTTILFASSDLDEVVQYSDRVLVFSDGRVSTPISTHDLTADRLGEMIGGRF